MALGENTDKEFIERIKLITLNHLEDERFGGRELALSLGMSWSTLNRKVQAMTGKHISQIIREIRLGKALELLQQNNATAAEVAFKVGFGSPAYFSKCFTQCFGFPPGEVKKRMAEGTLPLPGEGPKSVNLCPKEKSIFSSCSALGKPYLLAGSLGLLVLLLSIAIILIARKNKMTVHQGTQEKSIAVLPFKNYSDDPNNQYFADGINEEIINQLFRIGELRVVSRTTADRFRDSEWSTPEIAKAIGVNYILEGSVRKQDDQVRI
ncbi:MAG: helix-turn-helix domain-containing protein, partial [Bacteroides sp.]|nr:helix-turn-helix domain-containing protein [Bacteroides sp.]